MENIMDEHNRIKTSHDYIMQSMAKEIHEVYSNLTLASEALGRLANYFSNLKSCIADEDKNRRCEYAAGYDEGQKSAMRKVRCTNDVKHEPEVAQRVSVGVGDYNAKKTAKPLAGQVEPSDGKNITLRDVVGEILARSKYIFAPGVLGFRVVEDDEGVKVIKFRVEAHLPPIHSVSCHAIECFTVYLHRDLNNTVAEFDNAISQLRTIRIPLKSEDHDEWDSIN